MAPEYGRHEKAKGCPLNSLPQIKVFASVSLMIVLIGVLLLARDRSTFDPSSITNLCAAYSGIPEQSDNTPGMVWIKGGTFVMGNDEGYVDKESGHSEAFPEETGAHEVRVDAFWMDVHEVTNAQFEKFVKETGFITVAERKPKKEWLPPGFPEDQLIPGSAVFVVPDIVNGTEDINQWWTYVHGANWRHPFGPESNIKNKMNHPVVHTAYEDAQAYAKWAGQELPTEAQWEYAAKGGLKTKTYAWGDEFRPHKKWMANTWQGNFPTDDSGEDGHVGTAPVACYPPNDYGLYDVAGNVWEIVTDNYRPGHIPSQRKNPTGPKRSFDPMALGVAKHVIKGGSYLCAPGFCMRYRPSARQAGDYTMGTSHIGFRTVMNSKAL